MIRIVITMMMMMIQVRRGVSHIVTTASTSQAIKGIFSAGLVKTVRYSLAKLGKMFKSLKKK